MLTWPFVGVQWDRVIVLREQARSHTWNAIPLWERACSRIGRPIHHKSNDLSR